MTRREQLEQAGRWLRTQRERRGMSARQLATALDIAPQSVNNWETGKNAVSDEGAARIADVFDMDEIDVRRGLGLWVPEEHRGEAEDLDEQQRHYITLIEEARQAVLRRIDNPAERERLLSGLDRELEATVRHYAEMAHAYERGTQQSGA